METDRESSLVPGRHRGGPQIIPRPTSWHMGEAAPWSHLAPGDRRFTLDGLALEMSARGPGKHLPSTFRQETGRKSAVLCALFEDEGEPWVILTRRSSTMRSHTREVSFPGGRWDDDDDDFIATALREAEEEVNLDPAAVTIIGELDRFVTGGSGSLIHPYVGVLSARPPDLRANPAEVEAIRCVRASELLADDRWREEIWERNGVTARITFFELDGDTVWGATAAMLRSLLITALRPLL